MLNKKDEIIKENKKKVTELVTEYINDMESLSETDNYTIDNIEQMWSKLRKSTDKVFEELNHDFIKHVNEKKIIKEKK